MQKKETKHGLKTKAGILEKKLAEKEALLAVEPKSATGESLKESVRMLVSLLVGMGVAWVYQKYPVMGELQPDQTVIVVLITGLIVRSLDKFIYQLQKNHGKALEGVGIDWIFTTSARVFARAKTQPVQIETSKK